MDPNGRSRSGAHALLVRAGSHLCAIPLRHVVETMRPLPTTPLADTPPFVLGVSVIRGDPVPVIDLGAVLASRPSEASARYVLVRSDQRRFALAVADVSRVAAIAPSDAGTFPLLADACRSALDKVTTQDEELLFVLRAARLVPAEAWAALLGREKAEP